ncbi:hypothetical protein QJS83_02690 [Bdellovibrio sp. 22V]|uniref:hypothetical protein n=1 Tax=Bdellovibrio TaxID=958 RepID=UPI00254316B6|nr:hypothetical protein [Bdellovibrio sp. 22V]WII72776.1 hypothetical protein QJS83_02690 [Bdellovibrio sp. 22V]
MRTAILFLFSFIFPLIASADLSMSCSQQLGKCDKLPQSLQLAVDMCKMHQNTMGCADLAKSDPETAKHIASCDAKSLCDQAANKSLDQLKGCFAGTKEIAVEFWDAIASVPDLAGKAADNLKKCWRSEECRSNAIDTSLKNAQNAMLMSNPIFATIAYAHMRMTGKISDSDTKKMLEVTKNLLQKGKDYLAKQGVKLACYDAKTQAEMICYGVFSVVNPAGAAGLLAKTPKLAKLVKVATTAGKETKVANGAVDLARAAKLTNAQRVSEAEKLLGRGLSEEQKKALIKAHEVGMDTGRGYGTYSPTDLKQKADILRTAGFNEAERDTLMRRGIAGQMSNTQTARAASNKMRLEADKLRVSGDVKGAVSSYRNSADSYEVYIKDPKVQKSERDYLVGASLNAHAERYEKAAEYFLSSKQAITRSDEKAQVIFETLNREKDELRVIAAKNRNNPGVQKAYEDHRKMIEAIVNNPNLKMGDSWKRELLKP